MQRALSLVRSEGSENIEERADSRARRLSVTRQKYVAEHCSLNEMMRDVESAASGLATQVESHPQVLRKVYHPMLSGLADEAMKAGPLACQTSVQAEVDHRQPSNNFVTGMTYLV